MNIISIDLEANQPSNKIIQLGYVIANVKTKEIKVAKSIIINPRELLGQCREGFSITDLTGITQEQVDMGTTLGQAYEEMSKDMDKLQVTKHPLQWGMDHFDLRNELVLPWDEYVFRRRAHDIKSLYQLYQMACPNSKTIAGLKSALENLGMNWDYKYGPPHQALADAHNTLLTYWKIADKMKKYDNVEKVVITGK